VLLIAIRLIFGLWWQTGDDNFINALLIHVGDVKFEASDGKLFALGGETVDFVNNELAPRVRPRNG